MNRIDADAVLALIAALRRVGAETETVEAKSGRGGFPTSVRETLVAFANTHGGTVLIGIDELDDYAPVAVPEVATYRDTLVGIARDAITPPLTISTELVDVGDAVVLAAYVPPLAADQRPAYVTAKGITRGAYLRTGDGDHQIGQAELALVVANRSQPTYDREPVPDSGLDDLDRAALLRSLQRIRNASPRLRDADEATALHRLGVLAEPDTRSPLTLAGLMVFGEFPQRWFPQLMVSVVAYPPEGSGPVRFLDNETVRGSIPEMVTQAEAVVRRNIAVRAVMGNLGRRDVPEIPAEIIREALVNALLHRDYSPTTRGTQVAVNLYPDRLEVRSPGGMFGLSEQDLGQAGASSSRNMVLASLLADAFLPHSDELVAENRASGIPAMCRRAREHGLPLPRFRSTVTGFTVTIDREPLLGPATLDWIGSLAISTEPDHEVALAMLRRGPITERMLRRWGIERVASRRVLTDLITEGVTVEFDDGREPRYVLDVARAPTDVATPSREQESTSTPVPEVRERSSDHEVRDEVLDAVRGRSRFTVAEAVSLSGLSRPTVLKSLKVLIDRGDVEAMGAPNSPRRAYRWIGPGAKVPR